MKWMHLARLVRVAVIVTGLQGCGSGDAGSAAASRYTADLQTISNSIATDSGYREDAVDMTSSRVRLRIAIRDQLLADADMSARNAAATRIVAAAEKALAVHPEFASLEQISVAVIHVTAKAGAEMDWHTEDVVEFRKGPNGRFALHTT